MGPFGSDRLGPSASGGFSYPPTLLQATGGASSSGNNSLNSFLGGLGQYPSYLGPSSGYPGVNKGNSGLGSIDSSTLLSAAPFDTRSWNSLRGSSFGSLGGSPATSPENTLIVFDWDDTFLPTSALERGRVLRIPCQKLRPQLQQQLNALAQLCVDILCLAERFGKVVIITNSAPGWIDTSCQAFLPALHAKIRSFPIYAKPMSYLLTFKLDVFKRELGMRYSNLISVGDGIAERTATLRLIGGQPAGATRYCKSIKLKDMPSIQQLHEQLELVQQRFDHIVHYAGDLDVRANFGVSAVSSRMGSTLMGAKRGSGCSFVHLSHLGKEGAAFEDLTAANVPHVGIGSLPTNLYARPQLDYYTGLPKINSAENESLASSVTRMSSATGGRSAGAAPPASQAARATSVPQNRARPFSNPSSGLVRVGPVRR